MNKNTKIKITKYLYGGFTIKFNYHIEKQWRYCDNVTYHGVGAPTPDKVLSDNRGDRVIPWGIFGHKVGHHWKKICHHIPWVGYTNAIQGYKIEREWMCWTYVQLWPQRGISLEKVSISPHAIKCCNVGYEWLYWILVQVNTQRVVLL